jgi:hypothetical protein
MASIGAAGFGNGYWMLPKNAGQIASAIRYVAGGPLSAEFEGAPLTTVMELTDKNDGSERILHWLNYKLGYPAGGASVTVAAPGGKKVKAVRLLSPDRDGASNVTFTAEQGRVRFALPSLEVYNVAVLETSN